MLFVSFVVQPFQNPCLLCKNSIVKVLIRCCDCDVFGIRTLLDYLSSLQLLEREGSTIWTLLSWAESGGAAHSFTDYRIRLEDAGFEQVKQLGERSLSAIK